MNRLIDMATNDVDHFAIWIFSILSFCKKVIRNGIALPSESFSTLTHYILSNADWTKETADTVAEYLALCVQIRFEFATEVLQEMAEIIAPISMHAISIYLETASSDAGSQLLESLMSKLDPDFPVMSVYVLMSVKSLLKFPGLFSQLLAHFPEICRCVAKRPSQEVFQHLGIQTVRRDIGREFRLNAIETVMAFQKLAPELCPFGHFSAAVRDALDQAQPDDIKIRGLALLTELLRNITSSFAMMDELPLLCGLIAEIDQQALGQEGKAPEMEIPYLTMLTAVAGRSHKKTCIEFERLYSRRCGDPRIAKLALELSFVNDALQELTSASQRSSANNRLIMGFCPDAATVFDS
jgi:hypothetical protein